jgi:hypothetical protein
MLDASTKTAIRTVLDEAISMAVESESSIDGLRGIALFDSERDAPLTSLHSFEAASQALTGVPNFATRFGSAQVTRIILQFLYEYFARADSIKFEESVFEDLWRDFSTELLEAHWIVRSVANIEYFRTETWPLDLGDGISIQGRNRAVLAPLGFDDRVCDWLFEDLRAGRVGTSSYVLVIEDTILKEPSNTIGLNSFRLTAKADRALLALRLSGPGAVSIGPMVPIKVTRVIGRSGGITTLGASIPKWVHIMTGMKVSYKHIRRFMAH